MRFPTSKRGEGRRAHSRRKFALGAAVCLLALAACLAACAPSTAPQPTDTNAAMAETGESDGGDADASTTGSFSTAADFTDVSTGMFPDIQRNAEFQNAATADAPRVTTICSRWTKTTVPSCTSPTRWV